MAYEFIQVVKRDHLTTITINRPEVMNALNLPACQELDKAFEDFSKDTEAWLVILTASGDKAFCAGNDLKWQAQHGGDVLQRGLDALKGGFGGITRRLDCFKPIIAAVNGLAFGGGFELVLASDIVVAAEHATFGLPEPRVGMMAEAGGVIRLPRQYPYHFAMGLLLTGRRIPVQEAYRMGIVNEIVPLKELMPAAERWASEILACGPLAVRATKEAALKSLSMSFGEALTTVFPNTLIMRGSSDYQEGPRAFAEKRKPHWKGE